MLPEGGKEVCMNLNNLANVVMDNVMRKSTYW